MCWGSNKKYSYSKVSVPFTCVEASRRSGKVSDTDALLKSSETSNFSSYIHEQSCESLNLLISSTGARTSIWHVFSMLCQAVFWVECTSGTDSSPLVKKKTNLGLAFISFLFASSCHWQKNHQAVLEHSCRGQRLQRSNILLLFSECFLRQVSTVLFTPVLHCCRRKEIVEQVIF